MKFKSGTVVSALIILVSVGIIADSLSGVFPSAQYVKADLVKVVGSTVIIGSGCDAIVADTSPERAESIRLGIEKTIDVRPNTHDLFAALVSNFNITLERMTMDRAEGEIYFSTLWLRSKDGLLKLDARPSDALAVALRTSSPVFVNKTLLKENGEDACQRFGLQG